MAVKVIKEKCPQDHKCPALLVCPADALRQEGTKAPVVDKAKCIECYKCTDYCPGGALTRE